MRKQRHVAAIYIARVYAGLGNDDQLFKWLQTAVEERDGELVFFKKLTSIGAGDSWGNIRSDPRYQQLLRLIGSVSHKKAEDN